MANRVARYVTKYGQPQRRVAKAVLIAAVPPLMVKTEKNPGFPHGMMTTNADVINADILGFIRS